MTVRALALAVVMVSVPVLAACGGGSSVPAQSGETAAATAVPATPPVASAPEPGEPKTVADLFPAGPGRELVMNNCASCHNVACSAIGRRTPERWDSLKDAHKEQVSGADVDTIFAYLKANFDSSKPEPKVPPQFLEGGCTPF
jgi:mono/diheme cytochrome c family protein